MSSHHNPGNPLQVTLGGVSMTGFSISGLATYIQVPEYRLQFDCGHVHDHSRVERVFLSHVHSDHSGALNRLVGLRAMVRLPPPVIYVPTESVDVLDKFLLAQNALNGEPESTRHYELVGVKPGDVVDVDAKHRHRVHVLPAHHRNPSVGYRVSDLRSGLAQRFVGKGQDVLREMRARGETMTEEREVPRVAFFGDHTAETLRANPQEKDTPVVILECTFTTSVELSHAQKYGHTHILDLVDLASEGAPILDAKHILLKHFSMRDSLAAIRRDMDRLPTALYERVSLLLPGA